MESYGGYIGLFCLLCVIPLGIGLIVVLGIRGLPLSKRGFQSIIQMDGANFLKTDEGNIKIKRRTFFTWFIIIFFGICELGLIVTVISNLPKMIKAPDLLPQIFWLGSGILFLGFILFLNIRALLKYSNIQIDINSRTITVGKGATEQQILFSQAKEIFGTLRGEIVNIHISLTNDKIIEIGSVSGYDAQPRAFSIIQQIAEVTGAKIRES